MEQPQTIGDEHQPEVEWDPPPTLNEKFTREVDQSPKMLVSAAAWQRKQNQVAELTKTMLTQNDAITELYAVTSDWERRYKELEPDAALGASLRLLPECTALIRTPDRNGPQEWEVIMGDYNKPDYSCYGSTPEEALRNLFQCMAGES